MSPWKHHPQLVFWGAKLQGLVQLETNHSSWPQMCKSPPPQHALSLECSQSSITEQSQTLEKNRMNLWSKLCGYVYPAWVESWAQWPVDPWPVVFRGLTNWSLHQFLADPTRRPALFKLFFGHGPTVDGQSGQYQKSIRNLFKKSENQWFPMFGCKFQNHTHLKRDEAPGFLKQWMIHPFPLWNSPQETIVW